MILFWRLAMLFTLHFIEHNGFADGGEFLYISHNIFSRPNNAAAQALCKSYGNCELAVIDSQSEYDRMLEYFNNILGANFLLSSGIWIGLYWIDVRGNGKYVHFWEKSGQMVKLKWSHWDDNEPNAAGLENCVRIHTNMNMRSIGCNQRYDVLCEGKGQSSCIPTTTTTAVTENVTDAVTEITTEAGRENVSDKPSEDSETEIKRKTAKEDRKKKHNIFSKQWWTPLRVGLISGFGGLFVFVTVCYIGWKRLYKPKFQVGSEQNETIYKTENNNSTCTSTTNNDNCVYDERHNEENVKMFDNNVETAEKCSLRDNYCDNVNDTHEEQYDNQEISDRPREIKDNSYHIYNDDESHVEHVNGKTSNYVFEPNEYEQGNTESNRYVYEVNENHDEEDGNDDRNNIYGLGEIDEVDNNDSDGDNESKNIDNLKFDKVPAEPNLQQYDTNTVIPSKKYNSWMSEEELAPDLSNTNRQTNK